MKQFISYILILVSSLLLSNVGFSKTSEKLTFDKAVNCSSIDAIIVSNDVDVLLPDIIPLGSAVLTNTHTFILNDSFFSSITVASYGLGGHSPGLHSYGLHLYDASPDYPGVKDDKINATYYHLTYKAKLLRSVISLS